MKVCVLSHSAVVDVYREKFRRLAELGVEMHLALPSGWPEGNCWVAAPPPGREQGIEISVLPVRWPGKVGGFYLPGLGSWLKKIKPDILHVEEAPYALAGFQALWGAPPGCRVVFFTWENMLRQYRFPLSWFNQRMLARAPWALAGSLEARQVLAARGFRGQVAVIPQYGVNPRLFSPQAAAPARGRFTLGYFGRLLEEKGVQTLLRAAAQLPFAFELVITGGGHYAAALRAQTEVLGLRDRVRFQEAVPHGEMPAALRQVDVLVLPSETRPNWKEQFGRVLIEAMASGVPVVGSSSGEIPQVIGEAGLIFPEGDAAALAVHLAALQASLPLRQSLAQRGRERVLAQFTTEQVARQTLEVYRRMLGENQA